MPGTEEYIKRYKERSDGISPTANPTDNYYQMAKNQEYDLLFDKEVALENAKANALKYSQNQLNVQGFGGTGYGSTLQSGIYNTYLNRANEAKVDYANNIADINNQQSQAEIDRANDRFGSIIEMIQTPDASMDNVNALLTEYGYGSMTNGQFSWNEKPEGMSDDDWNQMKFYYRLKQEDMSQDAFTGSYYRDQNSFMSARIPVEGGKTMKIKGNFDKETPILFSHINAGDLNFGDYVKMTNGYGDELYVQYTDKGLKICSEKEYEEGANKHEIVRDGKDNYSWDSGRESKYGTRRYLRWFVDRYAPKKSKKE